MQLFVKKSEIQGFGVVAAQKISKGSVLHEVNTDHSKVENEWVLINQNHSVRNSLIYWANHSCNPNTRLLIEETPKLVTIKEINPGEEITYDYGDLKSEKISCNCGSENCKGFFHKRSF